MKQKTPVAILILIILCYSTVNEKSSASNVIDQTVQIAHLRGDNFNQALGACVALSGDTLAVGDPYDIQNGEETGSVTIYQSGQDGAWQKITRLTAPDAKPGMIFGRNIALAGDRLVVGAPTDINFSSQSGAAYIYERNRGGPNAWGLVVKLMASTVNPSDNYGWAVGIDGDTVSVGAYTNAIGGRVYIYEANAGGAGQWGEVA
jgi:hypothetical protein